MTANRPLILRLLPALLLVLLLGGCTSEKIVFNYPDEQIDLQHQDLRTPSVYLDLVTDMRPYEQRQGRGHFLGIDFPKDEAWEREVTEIYAEALAKDVEQTRLVQIVPLRGQADYVLSADVLSLGCRFQRSVNSFLLPALLGGALGVAVGEDSSDRIKMSVALGAAAVLAVPMPSRNHAEAEIRLTLRDRNGDILWQESCLGEFEDKVYAGATSRQDQRYVDEHLTKAVKRANGCLLMQMRQFILESKGIAR
jgi:hypothetical protein